MATPKQPQDRKPKAEKAAEAFTFEHDGKTYTLKKTKEHITGSFIRKHRHEDDFSFFCSMFEALAKDEATMDAFDEMLDAKDKKPFEEMQEAYMEHFKASAGADVGESEAS